MCGRYILVQKLELIEKRFNVTAPEGSEWKPAYNISPGQLAPVITSDNPKRLQLYRFGMTPFWAKKPMYMINARAEPGSASCRCHKAAEALSGRPDECLSGRSLSSSAA